MTNYVAIRMLFRPLKPWKIMGLRMPLTPGVIPSKRRQLARNIGEMVGEHLLTTADVGKALSSRNFQNELSRLIDSRLDSLLDRDLGSINELIPNNFQSIYQANIRVLRLRLRSRLHAYLDSEEFAAKIEKLIVKNSAAFFTLELNEAFPAQKREAFFSVFEDLLTRLLASPLVRDVLADFLKKQLKDFIDDGKSIADLVSEDLLTLILDRLEEEASPLLARLADLLKKPEIQKKISESLAEAAGNFTSSFGPLGAMLGGFISPDIIRDKVASFIEEKGDTISSWLESEEIRTETARLIREKAEEICRKPLKEFLRKVDPEKIDAVIKEIAHYGAERLTRPDMARGISRCLNQAVSSQGKRQLGAIAEDILGSQGAADYQLRVSRAVTSLIRSEQVKTLADGLMVELIEKQLLNKPVGRLSNLIPNKLRLSVHDYIKSWSSTVLIQEVPRLVDSLSIKDIVARKVDSLDLLRLEGLLMSIMQEQFKYINLFGGILGLIIGLLNLIFII